jgi:NADPH:quinone reductase-like Zn-dependent oxidoreductase
MKAVVIKEQNGEVAVEERERPSPGPGQVLLRVHASACATATWLSYRAPSRSLSFP